jgi:hypothetical protein
MCMVWRRLPLHFAMPTSAQESSLSSLQDDFAGLQKDFERDLKATVSVNMLAMDLFHSVQHLCHVDVIIFERDHEQRIAIDRATGSGDRPGLTTASHTLTQKSATKTTVVGVEAA